MLSCTKVVAIHKTALLTSEPFSSLFVLPRVYWIPRIITDSVAAAAARQTENILLKSLWFPLPSLRLNPISPAICSKCVWRGARLAVLQLKSKFDLAVVVFCVFFFCHYKGEQISSEHRLLLIWYFGDLQLIIHHLHQIISSPSSTLSWERGWCGC